MKKFLGYSLLCILIVGFLALLAVVVGSNTRADIFGQAGCKEVLPNVFDDERHGNVYFCVSSENQDSPDRSAVEMMQKMGEWQDKFPNKRILAQTSLNNISGTMETKKTSIVGIMVHYESKKEAKPPV